MSDIHNWTFRHYGAATFDPQHVYTHQGQANLTKPAFGLWASPIGEEFGTWREWCIGEQWGCASNPACPFFDFTLSPDANIAVVLEKRDLDHYPFWESGPLISRFLADAYLASGFDGIYCKILGHDPDVSLYLPLYAWDCDSIVVTNLDVVCPVEALVTA